MSGARLLTTREKKFVELWLQNRNGTRSYVEAGFRAKGDHIAASCASVMLRKPKIQAYIKQRQAELTEELGIETFAVLKEIATLAFSNMQDYLKQKGDKITLADIRKLSREQTAAISALETSHGGLKIKLADKQQALNKLGEHLGIFKSLGSKENPLYVHNLDWSKLTLDQIQRIANGEEVDKVLSNRT